MPFRGQTPKNGVRRMRIDLTGEIEIEKAGGHPVAMPAFLCVPASIGEDVHAPPHPPRSADA